MTASRITGELFRPVQRIVSLAPSLTENLLFLGLGSRLVGVTEQCDLSPEKSRVGTIGSFSEPDIVRIRELRTQLVLGLDRFHNRFADELAEAGIATMLFNYATVEDIFAGMEEIACAAGEEVVSAPLVRGLRDRVSRVCSTTARRSHPRVFRLITEDPMMTPSNSCFQTDAIRLAGGTTMDLDIVEPYVPVAPDELIRFDPEVVVSCGIENGQSPKERCPGCRATTLLCLRRVEELSTRDVWSSTFAGRFGQIRAVSCGLLCHPGPRTVDAIEMMADMFSRNGQLQATR